MHDRHDWTKRKRQAVCLLTASSFYYNLAILYSTNRIVDICKCIKKYNIAEQYMISFD